MRIGCKILAIVFITAQFAICQLPVEVRSTAKDPVGQRLAFAIKERVQKSPAMRLTLKDELRLVISIVTLEKNEDAPGLSTMYSISYLWNNPLQLFPFYLTSSVGYCGSQKVAECADGLVADAYEQGEAIVKQIIAAGDASSSNAQPIEGE